LRGEDAILERTNLHVLSKAHIMVLLILLGALALAAIVGTIVSVSYTGPRSVPTRDTVIR
jgi:hypothetical protein